MLKNKKIIVRLMGGLGNQFFQYGFARGFQKYLNEHSCDIEVVLDISAFYRDRSRKYELYRYLPEMSLVKKPYNYIWEMKYKITAKSGFVFQDMYLESGLFVAEDYGYLMDTDKTYFAGYWQNEKYIKNVKIELQNELSDFKSIKLISTNQRLYDLYNRIKEDNSVAIHVRRGDYLKKEYKDLYVVQDYEYYDKAMKIIERVTINPEYYIFSDDLNWCKEQFGMKDNIIYVADWTKGDAALDFEYMRNCKHFIIGNSTYSWWAAWLSKNEKGIRISPSNWFYNADWQETVKTGILSNYTFI